MTVQTLVHCLFCSVITLRAIACPKCGQTDWVKPMDGTDRPTVEDIIDYIDERIRWWQVVIVRQTPGNSGNG